ncbi:MAG: tRNA 2-thiouridine(34) synthase MnmA, partial [Clostridia bacterium]|nr:tRNA 2-thiouridine(34) synthase MnmA [Clostridia bacterium]
TYVLYSLTQEQLKMTLMPLGEFQDKDAVREKAIALNLPTAQKKDSMEICFVPDQDYAGFIQRRIGSLPPEGDFVDIEGNVLGKHRGIVHYTVGQRKGLGIAFGKPMFVLKIDPAKNQVVLGESGSEFSGSLLAADSNFIPFDTLTEPMGVLAKVRYSAKAAPATVFPEGEVLRVEFAEPQRAVTPGQAVVFYEENSDLVLGGATIL